MADNNSNPNNKDNDNSGHAQFARRDGFTVVSGGDLSGINGHETVDETLINLLNAVDHAEIDVERQDDESVAPPPPPPLEEMPDTAKPGSKIDLTHVEAPFQKETDSVVTSDDIDINETAGCTIGKRQISFGTMLRGFVHATKEKVEKQMQTTSKQENPTTPRATTSSSMLSRFWEPQLPRTPENLAFCGTRLDDILCEPPPCCQEKSTKNSQQPEVDKDMSKGKSGPTSKGDSETAPAQSMVTSCPSMSSLSHSCGDDRAAAEEAIEREIGPTKLPPMETIQSKKRDQSKAWIGVLVFALALTIGISVGSSRRARSTNASGAVLPGNTPTPSPTASPSSAPTSALNPIFQGLPAYTLSSLEDPSSPQSKARDWLLSHPELDALQDWRKIQLFALATFFYAMEGPYWPWDIQNSWMTYSDECLWFSSAFGLFPEGTTTGISKALFTTNPCTANKKIESLVLSDLDLDGRNPFVPPEIALLPKLRILSLPFNDIQVPLDSFLPWDALSQTGIEILNLHNNTLYGIIPNEISRLSTLESLSMMENALSGTLPNELGLLTKLTSLHLQSNKLIGSIPTSLGGMTDMMELKLSHNLLTSTIPTDLGLATNARLIHLDHNLLSGDVPSEIGSMGVLLELAINDNGLSGPIPNTLGEMSRLRTLKLNHNRFSGRIPTEIGKLDRIMTLHLQQNLFSGDIPSEFGILTRATSLYLSSNYLSREIPSEIGSMTNLIELILFSNNLTQRIPTELGQLTQLTNLRLSQNGLEGPIPSEVGELTGMENIHLFSNSLTGTLPRELGYLTSVTVLDLATNSLSGAIPRQLGRMKDLIRLDFHSNSLSSFIPTTFGALTNLVELSLDENNLEGPIPTDLGRLQMLNGLVLSNNYLQRNIPSELGLLSQLRMLSVQENLLSGLIPSELGLLSSLEALSLNKNLLNGDIPSEVDTLVSTGALKVVKLSYNRLSGVVSDEVCSLGEFNATTGQGLSFDCFGSLCGCQWCPCTDE